MGTGDTAQVLMNSTYMHLPYPLPKTTTINVSPHHISFSPLFPLPALFLLFFIFTFETGFPLWPSLELVVFLAKSLSTGIAGLCQ